MRNFLKVQKDFHTKGENEWCRKGDAFALKLFHDTAERVPAYKKFLKAHGIHPRSIRSIRDFKELPIVTKENYLTVYSLNELVPDGDLGNVRMISTSSGSTGKPFYWPRRDDNEEEAAFIHELFLTEFFNIDQRRTLFVNTFSMGMWVAGTTTYESVRRIAAQYRMTMVTPGLEIDHILGVIRDIGGYFEQIIIAGYPPFVKDIIDVGCNRGIVWKKYHLRFLFAAESFDETWREYIHAAVDARGDIMRSLNIYGTADALILAHETPLSILVRKLAMSNRNLHRKLFGDNLRIPTVAQFVPTMRYFEELTDSRIIFSAASGIPLIRYDIGDVGNIFSLDEIRRHFGEQGINLRAEIRRWQLTRHIWNLPLIAIYGRDRMTASLYGVKIYPEHVRGALEGRECHRCATGRFVMSTKTDKENNQFFEINVELLPGARNTHAMKRYIQDLVVKHLRAVSSEYKKLYEVLGDRAKPRIMLHAYQTSVLFSRRGKQQWRN